MGDGCGSAYSRDAITVCEEATNPAYPAYFSVPVGGEPEERGGWGAPHSVYLLYKKFLNLSKLGGW